ncbi:hypothetical protein M404DRAFT_993669 [Pisolithus tinctorius Marx 270]|uniref:Uncharacterized protein n=1 Tax=Pisolithus tinctorius Marx 270 TaxID=870435 RepID=A0A0C3PTX8_PISTI|nr:hypothetical protein M404DRAFT_993669 [Pisolithus tinctorius Marx 270]
MTEDMVFVAVSRPRLGKIYTRLLVVVLPDSSAYVYVKRSRLFADHYSSHVSFPSSAIPTPDYMGH